MTTNDPVFTIGQAVVATFPGPYRNLTGGKEYRVAGYQARESQESFTWPAYVTVHDDYGKPTTCYAHRFVAKGPA